MLNFKAKMHQIQFWLGLCSCPRPHWEITALPRPLSWRGLLLREGRVSEEMKGRGEEEENGLGMGRS